MTPQSYHHLGYQLDILGRPIQVGDRILTTGYGSTALNQPATVLSVNRKSISIDLEVTRTDWGDYNPITRSYPNRKHVTTTKRMKRVGHYQCLVIPQSLIDDSTAAFHSFVDSHPELAL